MKQIQASSIISIGVLGNVLKILENECESFSSFILLGNMPRTPEERNLFEFSVGTVQTEGGNSL